MVRKGERVRKPELSGCYPKQTKGTLTMLKAIEQEIEEIKEKLEILELADRLVGEEKKKYDELYNKLIALYDKRNALR